MIELEEAVKEVCKIGRDIEDGLEKAEAEAELRRWVPMPNGGHHPDLMRSLQQPCVVRRQLPPMLSTDQPGNGGNGEEK